MLLEQLNTQSASGERALGNKAENLKLKVLLLIQTNSSPRTKS